jgi:hypothetical protein
MKLHYRLLNSFHALPSFIEVSVIFLQSCFHQVDDDSDSSEEAFGPGLDG